MLKRRQQNLSLEGYTALKIFTICYLAPLFYSQTQMKTKIDGASTEHPFCECIQSFLIKFQDNYDGYVN